MNVRRFALCKRVCGGRPSGSETAAALIPILASFSVGLRRQARVCPFFHPAHGLVGYLTPRPFTNA